jgi:hypothetical protein
MGVLMSRLAEYWKGVSLHFHAVEGDGRLRGRIAVGLAKYSRGVSLHFRSFAVKMRGRSRRRMGILSFRTSSRASRVAYQQAIPPQL